jgi:hypothetical protein
MSRKNILYIHAGMPKTGTSAIQRMLANNRKQLAELGYIYPGTHANHWPLVVGLKDKERMLTNGFVQKTLAEIREWDGDAILSCEGFSDMGSAKMPAHLTEALRA